MSTAVNKSLLLICCFMDFLIDLQHLFITFDSPVSKETQKAKAKRPNPQTI